jgi:hypothetical protein
MHDHRALDFVTWVSGALAVVTFWQGVALAVTIIAGIVSAVCGIVRLYDRFTYGPGAE